MKGNSQRGNSYPREVAADGRKEHRLERKCMSGYEYITKTIEIIMQWLEQTKRSVTYGPESMKTVGIQPSWCLERKQRH